MLGPPDEVEAMLEAEERSSVNAESLAGAFQDDQIRDEDAGKNGNRAEAAIADDAAKSPQG